MTTQEINRYIAVASKWEEKYSIARTAVNMMQERVREHKEALESQDRRIDTLELQLDVYDKENKRKEAEIKKLKSSDNPYLLLLIGYILGLLMDWLL